MRLTNQQASGIIQAFSLFIHPSSTLLYLFGSRTKDHLKGGDIDLLLLTSDKNLLTLLRAQKHLITLEIQNRIGERKVDLTIALEEDAVTDPFIKTILPSAILLHQW